MNMCTMCGGSTAAPNYAKTVDPAVQSYGSILGDEPPRTRGQGRNCIPIQVCLPQISNAGSGNCNQSGNFGSRNVVVNVPRDQPRQCPQIYCEPCPPMPPTKVWLIKTSPMPQKVGLNKLLMFILSFAIAQPPPCNPCSRPIFIPCRPYC